MALILFLGTLNATAQQKEIKWKHLSSIKIPRPQQVSIDRYGSIYLADRRGNVHKLDTLGNTALTYSPRHNNEVSLLEAWRKVNIFVFNRNFQEYVLLDRFLTESPTYRFRGDIGFARLATYSADNNLWVIDEKEFSLKKYNLRIKKTELSTPLDLILNPDNYEMTFIREYQNLIFISDKNSGILIFDNMGNYKNKLHARGVDFFSFREDELYFIKNKTLFILNMYSGKEKMIELPSEANFDFILLRGKKAYCFTQNTMEIFSVNF
ncbi:hypothetical protein RCC89_20120 [Cytophagaceae bacterium ABcell3]|nr:hypothetical protein RCC89_20120 [Cytophagaceae bacterium ABcell3]